MKYNAIWDKVWNTGLFTDAFYVGEIARYKKEMLPYGVPLDSREKYTKSDWQNKADFTLLIHSLWSASKPCALGHP